MPLVDDLRDHVGDNLRAVAAYREHDCELLYERPDIASKPRVIDKIHEELILEGMGTEYLEDVFRVGQLNCTVHSFEEAMCFHLVRDPLEGVFISIEPDTLVSLEEFVTVCKNSEVEPSL